jgi:ATP-dependent Clp protease ATP-binding subunit ClpA
MFERFTDEARLVVRQAQEEARRLHHQVIGTEHLLLALAAGGEGPGTRALLDRGLDAPDLRRRVVGIVGPSGDDLDPDALATLGIDLEEVRRVTEASFGPGALDARGRKPAPSGHIPFSKRAKKVLELSLREALRLGHNYIGSGHILLGLIREGEGVAAKVLVEAGVDLPGLRDDVTRLISSEAA